MMLATLQIIAAIGGVAFVLGIMADDANSIGVFAAVALVAWSIVALQAGNITVVTDTGATVTRAEPTLQWLGLGLAGVSTLGVLKGFTGG